MPEQTDSPSTMPEEQRLLNEFAAAGAKLHRIADPYGPPGPKKVQEEWGLPIPLSQEGQLALLWTASFDAFEVVGILQHRAAPSVLAQLRYLSETLGLVAWLVETNDEKEQRRRSLSLAQAEVRDFRGVHSSWKERPSERKQAIADAKEMEARIKALAASERVTLIGRPGEKVLAERSGLSRFAYDVMSDIGSHAGLGAPLIFYGIPGENRFVMNPQSGVVPRVYYLGMGFELYGAIASNILGAFGLTAQQEEVVGLVESQRGNLLRAGQLMDEREG